MATVIITGASRGIGRAAAERFAAAGCDLIINCKSTFDRLDALAAELASAHRISCVPVHGRIDEASLAAAFDTLALEQAVKNEEKKTQSVDGTEAARGINASPESSGVEENPLILINNGGISKIGLLQDMTDAEWEEMLESNLTGMFRAARAAIPYMLRQGGRIINVSSVWGDVGASCETAYSATKGGINAFTRALAKELAPSHIPVNAIAFGAVDTDMNAWLSAEERAALEEEIPYGRMASAQEAAAFIEKLAECPPYLTGQVIRFDGAWI